jgi:hypothetical protein
MGNFWVVPLLRLMSDITGYYLDYQLKEGEAGGTCGSYGGDKCEILKVTGQLGSSRRGWEYSSRLCLKEIRREIWSDYVWVLIGTSDRLF